MADVAHLAERESRLAVAMRLCGAMKGVVQDVRRGQGTGKTTIQNLSDRFREKLSDDSFDDPVVCLLREKCMQPTDGIDARDIENFLVTFSDLSNRLVAEADASALMVWLVRALQSELVAWVMVMDCGTSWLKYMTSTWCLTGGALGNADESGEITDDPVSKDEQTPDDADPLLGSSLVKVLVQAIDRVDIISDVAYLSFIVEAISVLVGKDVSSSSVFVNAGGAGACASILKAANALPSTSSMRERLFLSCLDAMSRASYANTAFAQACYDAFEMSSRSGPFLEALPWLLSSATLNVRAAWVCTNFAYSSPDWAACLTPFAPDVVSQKTSFIRAWTAIFVSSSLFIEFADMSNLLITRLRSINIRNINLFETSAMLHALRAIADKLPNSNPLELPRDVLGVIQDLVTSKYVRKMAMNQQNTLQVRKRAVQTFNGAFGVLARIAPKRLENVEPLPQLDLSPHFETDAVLSVEPEKQRCLANRILPALVLAYPRIECAFFAYRHKQDSRRSYGDRSDSFLQIYVRNDGPAFPPHIIDVSASIRLPLRVSRACMRPSLDLVGSEFPESFEEHAFPVRPAFEDVADELIDKQAAALLREFPNVTGMEYSAMRQKGLGANAAATAEEVMAVYVFEKGIIPYSAGLLPRVLDLAMNRGGMPVDVREGIFTPFVNIDMVEYEKAALRPGCSISVPCEGRAKPGSFSIGVAARNSQGEEGFVTCGHGFDVPMTSESFTFSDRDVVAPGFRDAVDDNRTANIVSIGVASGAYVSFGCKNDALLQRFPCGMDAAFVRTTERLPKLGVIEARTRDWNSITLRGDEDVDSSLGFYLHENNEIERGVRIQRSCTLDTKALEDNDIELWKLPPVIKSGCTTGLTRGALRAVRPNIVVNRHMVVTVHDAHVSQRSFRNVYTVKSCAHSGMLPFASPGDSGAAVCVLRKTNGEVYAEVIGLILGSFNSNIAVLPSHEIERGLGVTLGEATLI